MSNPYIPYEAVIKDLCQETDGARPIKTFTVEFKDEKTWDAFQQQPGQCAMVGIPGVGESMISICSSPTQKGYLQFSIMQMGKVTTALHGLDSGDTITVRGPYGKQFPVDEWKGKKILTIGGGIGQAPLRPIINYVLDNRKDYAGLDLIYGARSPEDLVFLEELQELGKGDQADVHLTVDNKAEGWSGNVGFVPTYLLDLKPSPKNTIAITCGPPIMIKFVLQNLVELGFKDDQIFTTLENRMKCGIGKCGKCNVGGVYV
ncbi:MAG: heterodisulfide reductase subunit F, partial [Deltaproteobacteria bacterium]|nr:heterodisulfide reductase subunit F [Deltaproteobacteria bacterium]